MLLFIEVCGEQRTIPIRISKHRMLLFIEDLTDRITHALEFQNIVCYCLSCSSGTKTTMVFSFQNIVCYCLSFLRRTSSVFKLISKHRMLLFILLFEPSLEQLSHISKHRMLLFIEVGKQGGAHIHVYFKTSYVTVYRTQRARMSASTSNFKTSYVTVYRTRSRVTACISIISKHRMLLFIKDDCFLIDIRPTFQNIVCYCLSNDFKLFSY